MLDVRIACRGPEYTASRSFDDVLPVPSPHYLMKHSVGGLIEPTVLLEDGHINSMMPAGIS